jgi:hypothetical protein
VKLNKGSPKFLHRLDGPPVRLPSQLSHAGDLRLELTLGKKAGSVASGIIYAMACATLQDPPTSVPTRKLPPLVVKVSVGECVWALIREAAVYDEMRFPQGVRCFDYFEAEAGVESGSCVSPVRHGS